MMTSGIYSVLGLAIVATSFATICYARGARFAFLAICWLPLAALGLTATVPTLLIMLVYAVSGNWDAWLAGNLTTHRGFYGDAGPQIAWDAGFWPRPPVAAPHATSRLPSLCSVSARSGAASASISRPSSARTSLSVASVRSR